MSEHTPLPWTAAGNAIFKGRNCIGILDTDNASEARYRANAAFIVRAVNAHDELVEALEECLDIARRNEGGDYVNRAVSALAKARGEAKQEPTP